MASYKRFEMKQMMDIMPNNAQNSMDFLLMPPPNMQMNTPFVMSGERMSGGRVSQSNATPFLLNRDSSDRHMDLDSDLANWNVNPSKTNGAGTNTNIDRVVFRTNGVNLENGHSGAANAFSSTTNNDQFKVPNVRESTLNAAKRDLFNTDGMTVTNGHSDVVNGFSGSRTSTSTSNGHSNAQNNHSDVSNNHENVPITTNGPTNHSVATNNIFGGHQNVSNDRENKSNANKGALFNGNGMNDTNTRTDAENGLFGVMNRFTGAKNSTNDHQVAPNNNHSEVSNGHEKASNASVFSRLNYNSNHTGRNNGMDIGSSQTLQTKKPKYDAIFTNRHSMDADDNRFEDVENDGIYADDDDEQHTNYGQKNFNETTTATANQQTNAANLFGTTQFTMNGPLGTKNDNDLSQQPNGQTNSGKFFLNIDWWIPILIMIKYLKPFSSWISTKIGKFE